VNPIYAIMESAHRWLILAGIAFVAGAFGSIAMLAYVWPHPLIQVWLVACLLATVALLIRALLEWKHGVEADLLAEERRSARKLATQDE
jgi:hypothetical protein